MEMQTGNQKPTQCQRIVRYLKDFGTITQFEALKDLGIMRLASRISEMRSNGVGIDSEFITITNRYGEKIKIKRYKLSDDELKRQGEKKSNAI